MEDKIQKAIDDVEDVGGLCNLYCFEPRQPEMLARLEDYQNLHGSS